MKVLGFTNRKGGVGKTTFAIHVAAGLATLGFNVGIVDTDSQGNISSNFSVEEFDGLYNVLIEQQALRDNVVQVDLAVYSTPDMPSRGNLYIIPSYNKTAAIDVQLPRDQLLVFRRLFRNFGDAYGLDVLVVDMNPKLSLLDVYLYIAIDTYVFVAETERLAFEAIERSIEHLSIAIQDRLDLLNETVEILGILPNKYRANTAAHELILQQMVEKYEDLVWDPVHLRIVWAEASLMRKPLFTHAPSSVAASEAWRTVEYVGKGLKLWQES